MCVVNIFFESIMFFLAELSALENYLIFRYSTCMFVERTTYLFITRLVSNLACAILIPVQSPSIAAIYCQGGAAGVFITFSDSSSFDLLITWQPGDGA